MLFGPVFTREAVTTPRRARFYVYRSLYVTALLILMCTAWLMLAGTQLINTVGDMARFGAILFPILARLQLALVVCFSAMLSASAVAQEKDRKTLVLLLLTRMTNSELVLGKLAASLLSVMVTLMAALPVFMLVSLLGGVSFGQIGRVFAVTLVTAVAAGSLGSTIALWREKTFQTLSMTALLLVLWVGIWQGVGLIDGNLLGISFQTWATGFSPARAIWAATSPILPTDPALGALVSPVHLFLVVGLGVMALLNLTSIFFVRRWNPTREVRAVRRGPATKESNWGAQQDLEQAPSTADELASRDELAETARAEHVDVRLRSAKAAKSRHVWDNPVLWRETCTWAYGRKVLVIRAIYLLLFAMAWMAISWMISSGAVSAIGDEVANVLPTAVKPLAPFFLVSLVIINALAVTSITNERDGRSLDLLLVTDLSPKEFIFGKLGGVLWITREMIVLPILLCVYLWWHGGMRLEDLIFLTGGLIVLNLFVCVLGLHCGMAYSNSRAAIGTSQGTLFFLVVGVATCMVMMISFSGSFQTQLLPFLALILVGGVGLFVSLGSRNPSPAIFAASFLLPFATFYAITSFLLQQHLAVFLVTTGMYGFTIAAMMIPALGEFDVAMGRTKNAGEE